MVLWYLANEVFNCTDKISPVYLNAMFTHKHGPHVLTDSPIVPIVMRPELNLIQYGIRSFKSYGAKIFGYYAYII